MKKIKEFFNSRNLSTLKNRKRVGVIVLFLIILIFLLFTIRLSYIVITGKVAGSSLAEKTKELYEVHETLEAKRGSIFDKDGNVLVEDSSAFSLYAILDKNYTDLDGKKLYVQEKDWNAIADIFQKVVGIDKDMTLKQLKPSVNEDGEPITTVEFGTNGKNLNFETKRQIQEALDDQKISGIYFKEEKKRSYQVGNFASYFIGYTQQDDQGNEQGVMGIEEAYNDQLAGKNGSRSYEKNSSLGDVKPESVKETKRENGSDIYTTLDSNLQFYLEELMDNVVNTYQPEHVTATLMEAKTGNILATSQRPSFELDTRKGLDGPNPRWTNILLEEVYEPGSTMKSMMVASALQEHKFDENEQFTSGAIKVDDTTISDWNNGVGEGNMTFRQGLAWSSNVGMVTLQERMPELWQDYLTKFGFGQSTNFGLSGEAAGEIQNKTTVDRAMTSYGQGISVTHLQMLQAYTAIANNGQMLKPNIISRVVSSNGEEKLVEPQVTGTPISSETASKVLEYMKDVTTDPKYGMGKEYAIDGLNVSAKTGTAEFFENGIYQKQDYLHSVVTITPTEDPKYIFYMTLKRPVLNGTSANTIISEVANNLVKRAMVAQK
ncbi:MULTISPECIES: penicillin-binding transpeptidase domain-containing protein [unclassified Enterococcus]|uniref:penicillin-binding transpeptidase domain-containing protein n=1 Tax=unclassified Enterococcus TaxID=2608891 RepID=UPI001CE213A4|nr:MULTISPECIES: penicillin-binding transpeptidase domain-containing protein [unclassified Enterococcus]MCA5012937.1 penicillin-binding protein 2 [Enterococcus sp. S23]MCA5016188.1 penicillin-binding protein 2 [Enterococcus sp. S22(2020)]